MATLSDDKLKASYATCTEDQLVQDSGNECDYQISITGLQAGNYTIKTWARSEFDENNGPQENTHCRRNHGL